MNLDLSQTFSRAQTVVNGLVAAIPTILLALIVFGMFFITAAIVKGVVARLAEARLQAHRNAGVAVGRLAQGLVILSACSALSAALPTFRPGDVVQVLGVSSIAIGFASETSSRVSSRASSCSSQSPFASATGLCRQSAPMLSMPATG